MGWKLGKMKEIELYDSEMSRVSLLVLAHHSPNNAFSHSLFSLTQ